MIFVWKDCAREYSYGAITRGLSINNEKPFMCIITRADLRAYTNDPDRLRYLATMIQPSLAINGIITIAQG